MKKDSLSRADKLSLFGFAIMGASVIFAFSLVNTPFHKFLQLAFVFGGGLYLLVKDSPAKGVLWHLAGMLILLLLGGSFAMVLFLFMGSYLFEKWHKKEPVPWVDVGMMLSLSIILML